MKSAPAISRDRRVQLSRYSLILRLLFLCLPALAWCSCALTSRTESFAPAPSTGPEERARRFDRVERLVRTRYYTADLNGVNWAELCAQYRPLAVAAPTDTAWYGTVNAMLRELRDAHTRAERPEARRTSPGLVRLRPGHPASDARFSEVLDNDVVYLRFDRFDDENWRWVRREISEHRNASGIVLDLRHNRGGLVRVARRMVGLFFRRRIPMGIVVDRKERYSVEYSIGSASVQYDGPLAVLVGRDTHSSAEVFAYVMQYRERGVVIGQRTAGEVLGARAYRLRDGGQLYVSVTDFRRFDGSQLEGEGVQPDVVVPAGTRWPRQTGTLEQDPALAAALEELAARSPVSVVVRPEH